MLHVVHDVVIISPIRLLKNDSFSPSFLEKLFYFLFKDLGEFCAQFYYINRWNGNEINFQR